MNWATSLVAFKGYAWILRTSSRTAINGSLRFFSLFSFIMTHPKHYFEILFYVTFVFLKEKKNPYTYIYKKRGNQGVVKQQIWSSWSFDNQKHCWKMQKQPSINVFRKRCSENMQQIYRRLLMSKCDFNKVALKLYIEITLRHGCSPVNFLHIFSFS